MVLAEYGQFGSVIIFVAVAIGIANVCLLLGLIYLYWGTYRQVKSKFTIGLLYFSTFLLFQNILSTIFLALPLFAATRIPRSRDRWTEIAIVFNQHSTVDCIIHTF